LMDYGTFIPYVFHWTNKDDPKRLHHVVAMGHPMLRKYLRGPAKLFMDGTFYITPLPFAQTFVIMRFIDAIQMYCPLMYLLLSDKLESTYKHALHLISDASDMKLSPLEVTLDFERGLKNAASSQYKSCTPATKMNGCTFHMKRAVGDHATEKIKMNKKQVNFLLKQGVLDILCVIPPSELEHKGIPFVKHMINVEFPDMTDDEKKKWVEFWTYFNRHWMSKDVIEMWNLHLVIYDRDTGELYEELRDIQNRTNNALERYNRHLKSLFSSPHPSILKFIEVLKKESTRIWDILCDRTHERDIVEYPDVMLPDIPKEYESFIAPEDIPSVMASKLKPNQWVLFKSEDDDQPIWLGRTVSRKGWKHECIWHNKSGRHKTFDQTFVGRGQYAINVQWYTQQKIGVLEYVKEVTVPVTIQNNKDLILVGFEDSMTQKAQSTSKSKNKVDIWTMDKALYSQAMSKLEFIKQHV